MPTPDWNAFVRHTPQAATGCCVWTRMRSWEGLVVAARVPARNRFTRHISLRMAEGLGVRVWLFVASHLSLVAARCSSRTSPTPLCSPVADFSDSL
jgi:hypothetical protein